MLLVILVVLAFLVHLVVLVRLVVGVVVILEVRVLDSVFSDSQWYQNANGRRLQEVKHPVPYVTWVDEQG